VWQDTAIAICQCILAGSLIPVIRSRTEKPPLSTSFLNMTIVTFLTFVLGTLELWIAMASAALIAILWTVIFVQKLRINRAIREGLHTHGL
jgi:uncharacterized membrane protein YjjP (DUF1212 family)